MKWLHFGEQAFYESLTTSLGFRELCRTNGWEFVLMDSYQEMKTGKVDVDSDVRVVTFHAAHPKVFQRNTEWFRDRFPNAYLISLGSDSIAYMYGFYSKGMLTHKRYEFDSPEKVDLHLDLLSEVVDFYRREGINAAQWKWTASQAHLDWLAANYQPVPFEQKDIPFYSLIQVKTPYREKLRNILAEGVIGPNESDLNKVYGDYVRSRFIVGTTSGSWTPQRTMKGFRDWIAPTLGSVLIYDNHPDIVEQVGDIMPLYNYYKPGGIHGLVETIDGDKYRHYLELQKQWVQQNTIEKQFSDIITPLT